jgi:ornithine cyclodeaminase/alanine dehydrogenase
LKAIDDEAVRSLLAPEAALIATRAAFELLATGGGENRVRIRNTHAGITYNLMTASSTALGLACVKSYPVVRTDVSQASIISILVHDLRSGELVAHVQGDALGQLRTAATSVLASQLMARPDSATLAVFGTGFQALGHVRAFHRGLASLERVVVVGRSTTRAHTFVDRARAEMPALDIVADTTEEALRVADIVVTATGSAEPLFDAALVRPGTHINAVGSNNPRHRELSRATLDAAALVVVDDPEVAAVESGDLVVNRFPLSATTPLAELVASDRVTHRGAEDITVFESHGLALQDLTCAAYVLSHSSL